MGAGQIFKKWDMSYLLKGFKFNRSKTRKGIKRMAAFTVVMSTSE
ncbi:hypothetical protein ACFLUZ_01370 [Chloroflexota bacterium]